MSLSVIFIICDNFRRSLYERLIMFIILVFVLFQGMMALKILSMVVPPHPVVGSTVKLKCEYDMEGAEVYSVKWYKGGAEFYRYLPKDRPPAQIYQVHGTKVDMSQSDNFSVTLTDINLASSGIYRCEISAEAPSFTTVHRESEMLVITLPTEGPKITGGLPKYQVGDTVQVNCTSYRSKPAAVLSWTVNDRQPEKYYLREFSPRIDEDGLETSVLGLEFEVKESHFNDGEMKLRCTASIAPNYHQSNEESVSNSNQQELVLGIRETPNPNLRDVANVGCIARNWTLGTSVILLLDVLLRLLIR